MIIGLAGQINSGKNTVGDVICAKWKGTTMAFADQLKYFVLQMFPDTITKEALWGPSEKRTPAVREILQKLGTDIARKHDPNVWVQHLLRRVRFFQETGIDILGLVPRTFQKAPLVITDVRFPDEAIAVCDELKGYVIKIERPNNYANTLDNEAIYHASELSVNDIDTAYVYTVLKNDKSLDDLHWKIQNILTWIETAQC